MAKQVLEIEVPDGKKAVWKEGHVVFEDVHTMERIKTIDDAILFLADKGICRDILNSLSKLPENSFEWKVAAYRAVVAAVTYNEQRHLTTGIRWYPTIEFCLPSKCHKCYGNTTIGRIRSEGETFIVMGGGAVSGPFQGIGVFSPNSCVSGSYRLMGFRSVGSEEAALYISTQFGKLLFEISYGGTNCSWEWIS